MLEEVFKSVLIMSATGGVFTLLLMLFKPVSRRIFGEKIQLFLWMSVILVLVLPIKLNNSINLAAPISEGVRKITVKKVDNFSVFEDINGVYTSVPQKGDEENKMIAVGMKLWLWVGIGLSLKKVASSLVLSRLLYNNSEYMRTFENIEIRESDNVGTPLLAGFLKPVLYVPSKDFDDCKMKYIIAHEKVHVKRRDIPLKWFVSLVKCVHWFNPFIYIASKQLDESCELVCDIEASKALNAEEKKEYMKVILDVSQIEIRYKNSLTAAMSGGGKILKRRFEAIGKTHKNGKFVCFSGVLTIVTVIVSSVFVSGIVQGNTVDWQEPLQLIFVSPHEQKNSDIVRETEIAGENKTVNTEEKSSIVEPVRTEQKQSAVVEKSEEIKSERGYFFKKETVVFEAEKLVTSVEEDETQQQKTPISGEFDSDGGDTRTVYGVTPDANGKITIGISSNAQETVDIYIYDAETGKEVHSMGVPVPYEAAYEMEGLETGNNYNVVLKGTMRNDWNIKSEYTIQGG